jgi:hypothetical protein
MDTQQATEIVPYISSSVAGPLGIIHLPRLWLKVLLHAQGRLKDGYRYGVGGFDEALLTAFGIEHDAFVGYIEREQPGYLALETWVRANAKNLTPDAIRAFNERYSAFAMPQPRRSEWQARFGLPADSDNAIMLNNLDDWDLIHEQLIGPPRD